MNNAETDKTDLIKLVPRGGKSICYKMELHYTLLILTNTTKTLIWYLHQNWKVYSLVYPRITEYP